MDTQEQYIKDPAAIARLKQQIQELEAELAQLAPVSSRPTPVRFAAPADEATGPRLATVPTYTLGHFVADTLAKDAARMERPAVAGLLIVGGTAATAEGNPAGPFAVLAGFHELEQMVFDWKGVKEKTFLQRHFESQGLSPELTQDTIDAFKMAGTMPRGLGPGSAAPANVSPRTLPANSLTAQEVAEIQALANKYKTTIDVVGSRAAGEGRNIGSNLSVGKGAGTRSDIDFRIDHTHPRVNELIADLKKVGNGAGSAGAKWSTNPAGGVGRPTCPPFIRFSPQSGGR